jgi:hypothetical protein
VAANTTRSTAPPEAVPALGSASGGLRFELVLPEGNLEEMDDPFVPLSDTSRFCRVLLARIAMGENTTLKHLALKVQRSSYRPYGAGAAQITNVQVDELFERERRNLLQSASPEIATLMDLGPGLARSKPVTFCKKVRKYFHPICPKCTALLEDCRDDALLRDLGLPTYSGSAARYLHCRSCTTAKGGVFYTVAPASDEHPKGAVEIRRRTELYRDFASLVHGDARAKVERTFPCAGCPNRDSCYPAKETKGPVPAELLLLPVSYYEFASLPLELLQLHYDEFVDLLAGAAWGEVRQNAEALSPGRAAALAPIDAAMASPMQWIFRNDTKGLFSVEVLRLKLIAFTQLCRGLRSLHATTRQPHLDLNPTSVMATFPAPTPDLPSRWNFQVKLLDPASPHRFQPGLLPGGLGDVLLPPPDVQKTYASPIAQRATLGQEEAMRVTIRSLAADGDGMRGEVDVLSARARLSEYRPRDLVRVVATTPVSWLEGVELWGSIQEPLDGGFRVAVHTKGKVEGARVPVTLDGRVSFWKRFSIPADLYSLGVLLFRTLLVNDERDMFAVEDAVNRVLNKVLVGLEGAIQPDYKYVSGMLAWQMEAEKATFDPKSVLWSKQDRATKESGIPPLLWSDLLLAGFRLVSSIPGFSFCGHHGDCDPAKPEAVLSRVLETLEVINTRLHIELFGVPDRNREITAACDAVIAEITRDGLGGGEGGLEQAQFQPEGSA